VIDFEKRITELERSNAELQAALILAGEEILKLNRGKQDSPVLSFVRRTLEDARTVAKRKPV
jgi:hypothetical protein